jgi:hypothetical protein
MILGGMRPARLVCAALMLLLALAPAVDARKRARSRTVVADPFTLQTPPLGRGQIELTTLSTMPATVTGGDVLVAVRGLSKRDRLRVKVGRRDVSNAFGPAGGAVRKGLVTGLRVGRNRITAAARRSGRRRDGGRFKRRRARLVVRNHPVTGPVISGPHQQPFYCRTEDAGLGSPLDGNCSIQPSLQWFYRSSDQSWRELADPKPPYPPDIVDARTRSGKTVPFVVRVENRTINRGITRIAVLYEPGGNLWNGRLDYLFGESCGVGYHQGTSTPGYVLGLPAQEFVGEAIASSVAGLDRRLATGDMVVHSTQSAFGVYCNPLVSIETAMMVKEHVTEQYGEPERTLGLGASGGALQQYNALNNAPGLLDGATPIASFTDVLSTGMTVIDCALLLDYWDRSSLTWTDDQKTAVTGHLTTSICVDWNDLFAGNLDPSEGCHDAVPREVRYDPVKNPGGVRCTLQDATVNIWGRDPATGFAKRPSDNVGVQYGLGALNSGAISIEQFIDLNRNIGGFDIDGKVAPARMEMDAGTARKAYRLGGVVGRGALNRAPIIDVATYLDAAPVLDIHDHVRPFQLRERLRRHKGGDGNMSIFRGFSAPADAFAPMESWIEAVRERGGEGDPRAIAAARPAAAEDRCVVGAGANVDAPGSITGPFSINVPVAPGAAPGQGLSAPLQVTFPERSEVASDGVCARAFPAKGEPRMVAGGPLTDDIIKCSLKPVDPADYRVPVSAAQLAELRAIFAAGVCDWSKPGVGEVGQSMLWASIGARKLVKPHPLLWRAARSARQLRRRAR